MTLNQYLKGRTDRGRAPHDADRDQHHVVSQLAAQIGVTTRMVYRYPNRKSHPSGKTPRAILKITDGAVTPAGFLKPKRRCPTCPTPLAREAEMSAKQRNPPAEFPREKGITQSEFAEMIDVAPSSVGNSLNGERYPQVHTLRKIIAATDRAVSPEGRMNIPHSCDTCLAWRGKAPVVQ